MTQLVLPAYDWKPRPQQMRAWRALRDKRINTAVLAWHRRMGKDEVALHHTAIEAMDRVGNYWHMLPMQEQARKALWEAVNPRTGRVRWKDAFPPEIIEHEDNQAMMLKFKNGSTWQLLGSDNYNSLVGTTPVGMVFSEAALADPAAYGFFSPILLENDGWSLHVSSTRGRNHFHRLFESMKNDPTAFCEHLSAEDTDVFTAKQLAAERRRYVSIYGDAIGTSMFEQEYLSSWDAAIVGAVFGSELRELEKQFRALPLHYDPRYPVHTSWDIGVLDPTVILFWQLIGNRARLIDWYMATNTGIDHYAEVLASKPYFYQHHIGPHDTKQREWGSNGLGRMDIAKNLGIKFERVPVVSKTDSIGAGSRLIKMMEVNVHDEQVEDPMDDCRFILEALKQYRFSFDERHRVMSKTPVHDWTSHYADALMTFGLWFAGNRELGRPGHLQGRGADIQQFDNMRLRDVLSRGSKNVTGAFG